MKRYKLKKDLPYARAGEVFERKIHKSKDGLSDYDYLEIKKRVEVGEDEVSFGIKYNYFLDNFDDWFEEIPEEYKRWRAKKGEKFWTIWCNGKPTDLTDRRESVNDELYSIGNYFKTEEETSKRVEYLIALQTIKDDAKGFVPDWKNDNQLKYCGFYHYVKNDFVYDYGCSVQVQGAIYFKTKEDIEESFKKHRKEWLIVLGVEDNQEEVKV